MARSSKNTAIDTKARRLKLAIQREPHWFKIAGAPAHLGYRKTGDGEGNWIARYYSKEHGRRFESLGKADDSPTDMGSEEPESEAVEAYTVAQAVADYIADRERTKRKAQTRARLIVDAHIKPTLGQIQVAKLTHGKLKAWRDQLASSAPRLRTSPGKPQAFRIVDTSDPDVVRMRQATANRILTVLKAALNFAHEERKVSSKAGWEAIKPFRKVDVPKVRFLTIDEVGELMPACEPNFADLVKGALLTGCRYGELTAMPVHTFDADKAQVYVSDSKNGEARYVDLNDEGVAHFSKLTAGRKPNELIFVRSNGMAWKKSEQKRPMDAACELAKIEGVTFHILRHTYASHAVMNGMPIAVLSEQLGHKDTRITERHYAHLAHSYKQKLVRDNAPSFGFAPVAIPGPVLVARAG
jgi:integrase